MSADWGMTVEEARAHMGSSTTVLIKSGEDNYPPSRGVITQVSHRQAWVQTPGGGAPHRVDLTRLRLPSNIRQQLEKSAKNGTTQEKKMPADYAPRPQAKPISEIQGKVGAATHNGQSPDFAAGVMHALQFMEDVKRVKEDAVKLREGLVQCERDVVDAEKLCAQYKATRDEVRHNLKQLTDKLQGFKTKLPSLFGLDDMDLSPPARASA